jgi:hypothetical protein
MQVASLPQIVHTLRIARRPLPTMAAKGAAPCCPPGSLGAPDPAWPKSYVTKGKEVSIDGLDACVYCPTTTTCKQRRDALTWATAI